MAKSWDFAFVSGVAVSCIYLHAIGLERNRTDPLVRLVKEALDMNGANRRWLFLVVSYQHLGVVARDHSGHAFGEVSKPGQASYRWNLPIAGVALQMNRVQHPIPSSRLGNSRSVFVNDRYSQLGSRLGWQWSYVHPDQHAGSIFPSSSRKSSGDGNKYSYFDRACGGK